MLTFVLLAAPVTPLAVGIVGGGLAGLSCAFHLVASGAHNLSITVYEGSSRWGGRVHSGAFPDGTVFEYGGELIDSSHRSLRRLAEGFGLVLDDLLADQAGLQPVHRVVGYPDAGGGGSAGPRLYTRDEAGEDFYNRVDPATNRSVFQQVYADFQT